MAGDPVVKEGGGSAHPEPGWYHDPWRLALYRYWDGAKWTGHTSLPPKKSGGADEASVSQFRHQGSGDLLALVALGVLLIGGAAAFVLYYVLGDFLGITGEPEHRLWGWSAVLRGLPGAVIALSVPIAGLCWLSERVDGDRGSWADS